MYLRKFLSCRSLFALIFYLYSWLSLLLLFRRYIAILILSFSSGKNTHYILINIYFFLFAGARKWLASLDFDAENFKVAIINIYPRLASVPQYSLWNVKADKTLEKLPCMVNTPKRIKAYLGPTFTGSLVIMPSEEISLVRILFII